jgi:nucleoside-diphosphate-sugar epimerase
LNVKIARFHNIYGPQGAYTGGREKSLAAICRKVIEATDEIEVWGNGEQTRSYLYIDECLEGIERLMASDFSGPINLGSAEMVSINQLIEMCCEIKGKQLKINHIDGPMGVQARTSDNTLILEKLGWQPTKPLKDGLLTTYTWIKNQMSQS